MATEQHFPVTTCTIGDLRLQVPLSLAPMVGLSHSAMRTLLLELGGVGLFFTEMLAAKGLPNDNARHSPMLVRTAEEDPLFYQIFLADESPVDEAAEKLEQLQASGIDLNLGCPAPQLRRKRAGAYLAENSEIVRKVVRRLRRKTSLPISAKIRLGRSLDEENLLNFCAMLQGEGLDLLTVHARLHGESFCRRPRWEWVGKVKRSIDIPVYANGGIFTVEDARRCLELSGADGLMLGRGAIERPWLFAEIARELYGQAVDGKEYSAQELFFRFIELLEERFAADRRLGRLKQFTHYFSQCYDFGHHLATSVQKSSTIEEARETATGFFLRGNT